MHNDDHYPQLQLDNQICHRLYVLSNGITRAYRPLLKTLDITYPQYLVLMALWQHASLEVGEIQSLTKIDSGALSLILKKLQQKQCIALTAAEHDKRVKMVSLTAQGWSLRDKARDIPAKLLCQVKGLTEVQWQQFRELSDLLLSQLLDTEEQASDNAEPQD